MDTKVVGMLESDYDGMNLYVTDLRIGATALVLDKSVVPNELHVGTIAELVSASWRHYGINAEEILSSSYDATGEFISDDEIVYVGITFIHSCEDRQIVAETMDHIIGKYYTADDPEGYADSGENPKRIFANQIRKNRTAIKRDRKVAENRRHYVRICIKRGEM